MGVESEKLKYTGGGAALVCIDRESCLTQPDPANQNDASKDDVPIPPNRRQRLKTLNSAIQYHGGHEDKKLMEARDQLWLMECGASLDGALGFDDDLATATHTAHLLYRRIYNRSSEYDPVAHECLKLVRQIALSPDREWKVSPTAQEGKVSSYHHLQNFALFMIYDHQRRFGDLDMAKKTAGFMDKWAEVHAKLPPAGIDLKMQIHGRVRENYSFTMTNGEISQSRIGVFDWVSRNDIPELIEYLYDSRSHLTGQVIEAIPMQVQSLIGAPVRRNFIHENSNADWDSDDRCKIAVRDFKESSCRFVGWATEFLHTIKDGNFCTKEAIKASEDMVLFEKKGVEALERIRRDAERVQREWSAIFSPKPK